MCVSCYCFEEYGDAVQRLCGSLQVDISKARQLLGWAPPVTVDEGLRRAVAGNGLPRLAALR